MRRVSFSIDVMTSRLGDRCALENVRNAERPAGTTNTYVKPYVLRDAHGLAHQEPCLGQTVDGAEEGRHQQEALHVLDLHARVADVLQNQGAGHKEDKVSSPKEYHGSASQDPPLVVHHAHSSIVEGMALSRRVSLHPRPDDADVWHLGRLERVRCTNGDTTLSLNSVLPLILNLPLPLRLLRANLYLPGRRPRSLPCHMSLLC